MLANGGRDLIQRLKGSKPIHGKLGPPPSTLSRLKVCLSELHPLLGPFFVL